MTRQRVLDGFSHELWRAYCGATLTYPDYRECIDTLRDKLSWDSLLGIKQYSLYELLDDEKLVETMTSEE